MPAPTNIVWDAWMWINFKVFIPILRLLHEGVAWWFPTILWWVSVVQVIRFQATKKLGYVFFFFVNPNHSLEGARKLLTLPLKCKEVFLTTSHPLWLNYSMFTIAHVNPWHLLNVYLETYPMRHFVWCINFFSK